MENDVLREKAESLLRCIARIESHVPMTFETLERNFDVQDAIILNLQRAVQQSVDIASILLSESDLPVRPKMAELFRILGKNGRIRPETAEQMAKAVGFRNISVHEYTRVDLNVLYAIIHHHLDDFRTFLREAFGE